MKAIHNAYGLRYTAKCVVVNIIKSKNESNSQHYAVVCFQFEGCCKYH